MAATEGSLVPLRPNPATRVMGPTMHPNSGILPGIYATDAQISLSGEGVYQISEDIGARLDAAVHTLITETLRPVLATPGKFAAVPFAQVRCSV